MVRKKMCSTFKCFGGLYEFVGIDAFAHIARGRPQIARHTQQLP